MVEEPAQAVGHRLRLVVVVEAGPLTPATIAAKLDQTGPELDPEDEPAKQKDEGPGRHGGPSAQEDGEESRFEEERLPPERVEDLADVHDRLIKGPQRKPDRNRDRGRRNIRQPDHHRDAQQHATPGDSEQQRVGVVEMKKGRGVEEPDPAEEQRHGQQSVCSKQRPELECRDQKGDEVDHAQRALDEEPGQPVVRSLEPIHLRAGEIAKRRAPRSPRTFRESHRLVGSRPNR